MRKRLGARLLAARVQTRQWNVSEAASAAGIDPKSVRRIELGQNYEWDSLERYAKALGRPLEAWLAELVHPGKQRDYPSSDSRVVGGQDGSASDAAREAEPVLPEDEVIIREFADFADLLNRLVEAFYRGQIASTRAPETTRPTSARAPDHPPLRHRGAKKS